MLLDDLNESQREAVKYIDGPSLVIAGAGAGKTRVLTYKIAYLIQQGMKPRNILALTFTNKAAREMKERIGQLVGAEATRELHAGTFHSVFSRILRGAADRIGFTAGYTIYDQADSRSLVKTIIREMGLDDKVYKPSSVADRISTAKNDLILPKDYYLSRYHMGDAINGRARVADIYERYAVRCRQANAMDFDDLLLRTWLLFLEHEDIRRRYADHMAFVLVDEYQDTNYAQQAILTQLTKERQRICVVGDDAQSIYSFRGARIDNILNFTKVYSKSRLFKLERNYRSTQTIVSAANSVIKHNKKQIPKEVYSKKEKGEPIAWFQAASDREEAAIVCKEMRRLKRTDKERWSDFAVLYRTNAQSRSFEEQLRKEMIPYRVYGGLSFYQRKEIKDIIAYFRLVCNPDDEEAFKRIINYPTRGIGNTTLGRISAMARQYGVSFWQIVSEPMTYPLAISAGIRGKIDSFQRLISSWRQRLSEDDAYVLGMNIVTESGIKEELYSSRDAEYISKQENLNEFLSSLNAFVNDRMEEGMGDQVALYDFLHEVALLSDMDNVEEKDSSDRVTLMTMHSAKGLEFPTVFIVGMEEGLFPSQKDLDHLSALEEERRLFYVALTRAERHCILTSADCRYHFGTFEYHRPSRFLNELGQKALKQGFSAGAVSVLRQIFGSQSRREIPNAVPPSRAEQKMSQRPSDLTLSSPLKEGDEVEHRRFGVGIVRKVEGTGENTKATISFRNVGTKQLLLKFAVLTRLSGGEHRR